MPDLHGMITQPTERMSVIHNRPPGCPFELEHFVSTKGAADTKPEVLTDEIPFYTDEELRRWGILDRMWTEKDE